MKMISAIRIWTACVAAAAAIGARAAANGDSATFRMWTAPSGEARALAAADAAALPPIVSGGETVTATSPRGEVAALPADPSDPAAATWSPAPDRNGTWTLARGGETARFVVSAPLDETGLLAAIDEAGAYHADLANDYPDVAGPLADAIAAAMAVRADSAVSQAELDAATLDLSTALTTAQAARRAAEEAALACNPLVPVTKGEGAIDDSRAQTYEAYVLDADGNLHGTARLSVGRPNRKTRLASVRLVVQSVGGAKQTFKATERNGRATIPADAAAELDLAGGGQVLRLKVGTEGVEGTWGSYKLSGVRTRPRKEASVYAQWAGKKTLALATADGGYASFSLRFRSNGAVKVGGTAANGASVSANVRLLLSDSGEEACVAVAGGKKAPLGFVLWLRPGQDGGLEESVESVCGGTGGIAGDAVLPQGAMSFAVGEMKANLFWSGRKLFEVDSHWVRGRAGSAEDGQNGLKLSYLESSGEFRGQYTTVGAAGGKSGRRTATVRGVFVDGVGYGTAFVKGAASEAVRVE